MINRLRKICWWNYGIDILAGIDITEVDNALANIEKRIQDGFLEYECEKFKVDLLKNKIYHVSKNGDEKILFQV